MTEFFTRETWRAGGRSKLRKRVNNYGGCKAAPPAFLAAAKLAAIKPGRANRRLCSSIKRDGTPCRRLAMKDCRGCESAWRHSALARAGKFQPTGRTAAFTGGSSRRPVAVSAVRTHALAVYRRPVSGRERDWRGPGRRRLGCRWCGKFRSAIFNFMFEDQAAQVEITQSATVAPGAFGASFIRRL